MIVVGLMGGLGNQMFQYASAKAVARNLNTNLRLDITLLLNRKMDSNFTYRNYELSPFDVKEKVVTRLHQKLFVPDLFSATEKEKRRNEKCRKWLNYHLYQEQDEFTFEKRILSVKNNTYLFGYFQTEKYFENIRKDLLTNFQLREELDNRNLNLLQQINATESVSLHVRRGDYVNAATSIHKILTPANYYKAAVEKIKQHIVSPHFFIFSDDPDYVRAEYSFLDDPVTFISNNVGTQSYRDIELMRHCKHHIIANSSFSWWGAWLNENAQKLVVAPGKWLNEKASNLSPLDLLPSGWVVIPINDQEK